MEEADKKKIREKLEKQLELLLKRSQNDGISIDELNKLSCAIVNLANVLVFF